ncbi:MAG: hypothetical protein U7123_21700 [Potamolinea sp.]
MNTKKNYDEPDVKQTFEEINLLVAQQIKIVSGCIKVLENIRDEEEAKKGQEKINSVIEKLQQLI